jgi:hypothetical protein
VLEHPMNKIVKKIEKKYLMLVMAYLLKIAGTLIPFDKNVIMI